MSQGIEKGMIRVKYISKLNWDFIVFEKKREISIKFEMYQNVFKVYIIYSVD